MGQQGNERNPQKIIEKNMNQLTDNIDCIYSSLWNCLISKGIVSMHDAAHIKQETKNVNRSQVEKVLQTICRKSWSDFISFVAALEFSGNRKAADILKNDLSQTSRIQVTYEIKTFEKEVNSDLGKYTELEQIPFYMSNSEENDTGFTHPHTHWVDREGRTSENSQISAEHEYEEIYPSKYMQADFCQKQEIHKRAQAEKTFCAVSTTNKFYNSTKKEAFPINEYPRGRVFSLTATCEDWSKDYVAQHHICSFLKFKDHMYLDLNLEEFRRNLEKTTDKCMEENCCLLIFITGNGYIKNGREYLDLIDCEIDVRKNVSEILPGEKKPSLGDIPKIIVVCLYDTKNTSHDIQNHEGHMRVLPNLCNYIFCSVSIPSRHGKTLFQELEKNIFKYAHTHDFADIFKKK